MLSGGHTELYKDGNVRLFEGPQSACLLLYSTSSAGAIGKVQGESFAKALNILAEAELRQLTLLVNSSGAHFEEPMEGLLALNTMLETLWRLRSQSVNIRVVCNGWLYGGMGMLVAAVAHEVILTPQASWGLLGRRVTGQENVGSIPVNSLQPPHLLLQRVPVEALPACLSGRD